jgi:hypothetical protein
MLYMRLAHPIEAMALDQFDNPAESGPSYRQVKLPTHLERGRRALQQSTSSVYIIAFLQYRQGLSYREISVSYGGGATSVGAPSQSPFRLRLRDERRTRLVTQNASPAAGNEGGGVFLLNSDPGKIMASELQGLIDNQVIESRDIEYKRTVTIGSKAEARQKCNSPRLNALNESLVA